MARSIFEIVDSSKVKTNRRYCLTLTQMVELGDAGSKYDALYYAFQYGYIQGTKAEKAAQRKLANLEATI